MVYIRKNDFRRFSTRGFLFMNQRGAFPGIAAMAFEERSGDTMQTKDQLKVWYLYHSGYAVQTGGCLLIFDYWNDKEQGNGRDLENGVFDPVHWLKNVVHHTESGIIPSLVVFSSHKHGDHFNPDILFWQNTIPSIRYILSQDIPRHHFAGMDKQAVIEAGNPDAATDAARIVRMKPHETFSMPELDLVVHTFRSTDAGVAFWVEVGGRVIYHAGDLNLWHWEEESKSWNNGMRSRFSKEMDRISEWSSISGKKPDVAFLPVDPRLESHWLDGYVPFMEKVGARTVFPMHFGTSSNVLDKAVEELRMKSGDFASRLQIPRYRGELFVLD